MGNILFGCKNNASPKIYDYCLQPDIFNVMILAYLADGVTSLFHVNVNKFFFLYQRVKNKNVN